MTPLTPSRRSNRVASSTKRSILECDNDDSDYDNSIVTTMPSKRLKQAPTPTTPSRRSRVLKDGLATPPTTPQSPSSGVYSLAKSLFQRSSTGNGVIGRDKERKALTKFLDSNKNGSLVLTGTPGTGKSALVREVTASNRNAVTINCVVVNKPEDIYDHIYSALTGKSSARPQQALEKLFFSGSSQRRQRKHVVVLDELDDILRKDQHMLLKLFQWVGCADSSLLLIGIANALDLTDRFLPRLRANNITPQVLPFTPYTSPQIAEIIENKLKSMGSDAPTFMHPAAIQLCARKTASNTGDIRKAFDVCKRAIELVEDQARKAPEVTEVKPATVMHVSKICSVAFGGSSVSRIKSLNFHQKALLCVLVQQGKELTLTELFESFNKAGSDQLQCSLQYGEFLQLISSLESTGVARVSASKNNKGATGQKRISSNVQKMELMTGISDVDLLKSLIR